MIQKAEAKSIEKGISPKEINSIDYYFISKEPFKLIEKTIKKILKKPFKFEDLSLLS